MTAEAARRPRVLVVDDQPLNIRILHMMLSPSCQVFMATSGAQAITLCRNPAQPPDLVLLDVVMPDMDGYEVCRRLKSDPATRPIRVVFVTAHDTDEERAKAMASGAAAVLVKPVRPQDVAQLLESLRLGA